MDSLDRNTGNVGDHLRHGGVRSAAHVLRGAGDRGRAILKYANSGSAWTAHAWIGSSGHSHSDQQLAITHGTGFRIALCPSKFIACHLVALFQILAGEWLVGVLVLAGMIHHAQFDRIHLEFVGKLIHGRFKGI